MERTLLIQTVERTFGILEVLGLALLVIMAFAFQFVLKELPCPLCLLQRVGFLATAFGFLLNLRFGLRPSHYALALISALFTAFVALRQTALHILPGSGSYGSAIFGLHMYTWSFTVSMVIVIFVSITLGIDRQYQPFDMTKAPAKHLIRWTFAIIVVLLIANIVSTFMECGMGQCPDNPVQYLHGF